VVARILAPALHRVLELTLALPYLSEVIVEAGNEKPMAVATLIAVDPMDVVEADLDAMCTVLQGFLEVALALGPFPDVRAIDLFPGVDPLVILGEAMVTFAGGPGRAATVCVPVALGHHHTPGLDLVRCHTRPIQDLAEAEVALGLPAGGEGATVVMTLGIVGQDLHETYDSQPLYYKYALRYSWYAVSVLVK
jgi:hypothetical protein